METPRIRLLMTSGFSVINVVDGAMNHVALHLVMCFVVQNVPDKLIAKLKCCLPQTVWSLRT